MKKITEEYTEAAAGIALMVSATYMISLLEEDVLPELPDGFDKTKAKMKELQEQFNKELEAIMPSYLNKE